MRRVSLDRAPDGATVARTVHSLEGVLLLSEGTVLTPRVVERLLQNGVRDVYIEDAMSKGLEGEETIQQDVLHQIKQQVKEIMSMPSLKSGIHAHRITEMVERLLEQILASGDILHHLSDIRSLDDYTFSHCVNVAVLSLVTGIGLGMRHDALREMGAGAVLHDVGKLLVDEGILQKPSGLSPEEFEAVKLHTRHGHDIIRSIRGIPPSASVKNGLQLTF